jgi:hypothetical protein
VEHLTVVGAVQRRHELAPGIEPEMRDAPLPPAFGRDVRAEVACGTQEADLGRVA